jgi:3alpha(or 20beta)-hydroxysteroid dehydrogenase
MGRQLEGQYALVTGAARGIGAAIVREFVAEGARVLATDIRLEEGSALVSELGTAVEFREQDVTSESAWRDLAAELASDRLDILVNNAGAVVHFVPLHEYEPSEWNKILDVNLTSVFLGMRFFVPLMLTQGRGSIVNMSSIAGLRGIDVAPAYAAAKAGVHILTKCAALTYADQGIRVNSVHPGLIETPMVIDQPKWATEGFLSATPMGRMGAASEVAKAVAFLASGAASFITGAELYVDGAYLAK